MTLIARVTRLRLISMAFSAGIDATGKTVNERPAVPRVLRCHDGALTLRAPQRFSGRRNHAIGKNCDGSDSGPAEMAGIVASEEVGGV